MSAINGGFDFDAHYPWITKDFFQQILEKEFSEKAVTVLDYKLKHALSTGENYASLMIRVIVSYRINGDECVENMNFVIKVPVPIKELREIFDEMKLFENEIIMYEQVLPVVNELLLAVGENVKLAPK